MGRSVIDYAICNSETWEKIEEFKVGERRESDYLPLEVTLGVREMEKEREEEAEKFEKENWEGEKIKRYKKNLEKCNYTEKDQEESLAKKVRNSIVKQKIRIKKEGNHGGTRNVGRARRELIEL